MKNIIIPYNQHMLMPDYRYRLYKSTMMHKIYLIWSCKINQSALYNRYNINHPNKQLFQLLLQDLQVNRTKL